MPELTVSSKSFRDRISRRTMLQRTGKAIAVAGLGSSLPVAAARIARPVFSNGAMISEPGTTDEARLLLAEGGNAADAAVMAALVACIVVPDRTGVGGYGGHMVFVPANGRRINVIDFNTAAPAAARADMYHADAEGKVKGRVNFHGWLSVGVPGVLAGLQLALDKFGTRSFAEVVQPAIRLARDGFIVNERLVSQIESEVEGLSKDPASARIFLRGGQPPKAGERLCLPELAEMLSTLAQRNSVKSFYDGDIGQRLAEAFEKGGGLVTAKDLQQYRARLVTPLRLKIGDFEFLTAPLTAGGFTIVESFQILEALDCSGLNAEQSVHARLECLRLAWKDRLGLLGDPEHVKVPTERLLSKRHAEELAAQIVSTVKEGRPVSIEVAPYWEQGTVHISCADREGNLASMTLTHGWNFGAETTVPGLGVLLGHGMSRFNPVASHPNCPGPGKRPLHNMCPSALLKEGKPVLAVGGAGGMKIPNSLFTVVHAYASGRSMEQALNAPRWHTTGRLVLRLEESWPAAEREYLRKIGFEIETGPGARIGAAELNRRTGKTSAMQR